MTTADAWSNTPASALLVLSDGSVIEGQGLGATGQAVGEICFNTAMTGYQEILTDPSYSGQIITFTFPHIGNVGTNDEDIETVNMAANSGIRGVVLATSVTDPANYRAAKHLDAWLKSRNMIGISGVDTRALTALIRDKGVPNGVIAHAPDGHFDVDALKTAAANWPGLVGMDLAKEVSSTQSHAWSQKSWTWEDGHTETADGKYKVVALDFGVKRNILRLLTDAGCDVTVLPASATASDVLAHEPDGIFLSNGPGDPAATGTYAVNTIKSLVETGTPVFGICLGHQMLALALGGQTVKMHLGHHGANHPVLDQTSGKVEITSMNHGFAVDADSLPDNINQTHVSLFDGSNCGLAMKDKPVFSVQYHPEASPGPRDSRYLFKRFTDLMDGQRAS